MTAGFQAQITEMENKLVVVHKHLDTQKNANKDLEVRCDYSQLTLLCKSTTVVVVSMQGEIFLSFFLFFFLSFYLSFFLTFYLSFSLSFFLSFFLSFLFFIYLKNCFLLIIILILIFFYFLLLI